MARSSLASLFLPLLLLACGGSTPQAANATSPPVDNPDKLIEDKCVDLPDGFGFHPAGKLAQYTEQVTLVPPNTLRIERTRTGANQAMPVLCDAKIVACTKGDPHNTAEIVAALANADVKAALDAGSASFASQAEDMFTLTQGTDHAVKIGAACAKGAADCKPAPPGVAAAMQLLLEVYEHALKDPSCKQLGS